MWSRTREWARARVDGLRKITFFPGETRQQGISHNKGPCLSWLLSPGPAPAVGHTEDCGDLERRRSQTLHCVSVCSCGGLRKPTERVRLFPGFRQGARGRPFTGEHWGASVYALCMSQLSLELWQSLALPGLFCALDPKLITKETVPLLTHLIWKLLSNGHFILVVTDITPRTVPRFSLQLDWIERWSLEQKEGIQMWIDMSSNMQMFFGRSMNILNLLQVVRRVELEIEKILWQEKSIFHFSLNLPFLKIIRNQSHDLRLGNYHIP